MPLIIVLYVLGACLLCFFIYEKIKAYSVKATVIKSLTSVGFMGVATVAAFLNHGQSSFPYFIIMGLLFGLLGDIWLDLKYVYRPDDTIYTYAGFGVFAVGHIIFIIGMIVNYGAGVKLLWIILPLVVGLLLGVANGLLEKPMKMNYGKYKGAVMGYGGILIAITLLSLCMAWSYGFHNGTLNMMLIGTVLFLISDLILSQTYFGGEGKEAPVYIITNYVFYYAAMYVIASSILLA